LQQRRERELQEVELAKELEGDDGDLMWLWIEKLRRWSLINSINDTKWQLTMKIYLPFWGSASPCRSS
jgi:hypothetical protein